MKSSETEKYCLFAIDILYSHLHKTDMIYDLESINIDFEIPMFVTWKNKSDHMLRGCIGTTSPISLLEGLKTYSIRSALNDGRFFPIKATELESLVCTISLLTDYEECAEYNDWKIGKHGISIKFKKDGQSYHAIFLPEVMIEHGLDHKTALYQLISKSGYSKEIDENLLKNLHITRFQSKKSSVDVTRDMTVEENSDDLASSWQQYVGTFYYEILRDSLEKVLKKSEVEGLSDLNCIVFKLPIELDFSHLINYNPEFYDHFISASPEELKGLIRESAVPLLQEMVKNIDRDVKVDKRQVSVEISMKNIPFTPQIVLDSSDFYQMSIPKFFSDNLDLKGIWNSNSCILSGKIIALSESFYLSDIQTFTCTNPRCRNNKRVIRHVGFDQLEQSSELGTAEESKPEVFVTSLSKSKTTIKCHNCREEISELYPFRSNLEFKLAKLKVYGSCFSIDLLIVGSKNCSKPKLSASLSFIGFPKLAAEIPHQLNFITPKLKHYYFEAYGIESEVDISYEYDLIKTCLKWLCSNTTNSLRFPFLIIICQIIGSNNNINFNIGLPGIEETIILKISKLLNLIFNDSTAIGSLKSNSLAFKSSKQKGLEMVEEIYPYHVNIVKEKDKLNESNTFIFIDNAPNDHQLMVIPVDLSLSEEAEIILKTTTYLPEFVVPKSKEPVKLSASCVKSLQAHFLSLRSSKNNLPLKFSLNFLTKLAQISAISQYKQEANSDDAQFAIMIHEKIIKSCESEDSNIYDDFEYCENQIMSPSVSFDIGTGLNDFPSNEIKKYYGII